MGSLAFFRVRKKEGICVTKKKANKGKRKRKEGKKKMRYC
jgi:hypothetical protein